MKKKGTVSGTVSGNELIVKRTESDGTIGDYKFIMSKYGSKFTIYYWFVFGDNSQWIPSTDAVRQ